MLSDNEKEQKKKEKGNFVFEKPRKIYHDGGITKEEADELERKYDAKQGGWGDIFGDDR